MNCDEHGCCRAQGTQGQEPELRRTIDNHHIEALLCQADRGSDEVRTRLDLDAEFQKDAAQNLCSRCVDAHQER